MADRFFDTSAVAKHYRAEVGTAQVDGLLAEIGARHYLSDLSVVELHSVFARLVRTGEITDAVFHLARGVSSPISPPASGKSYRSPPAIFTVPSSFSYNTDSPAACVPWTQFSSLSLWGGAALGPSTLSCVLMPTCAMSLLPRAWSW